MSNSYKLSVSLADIEPGNNPRKDFGDIDALAATIDATGGQPINPLIVVRDGNKYRLVDGERRYRALVKLHGLGGRTDVLCFADYDEAQEAVAMIATDDKMQLSESERAQGFQTMMLLGVESRTIAKAMHRKTADIAAARAVAKDAPAQATIDQMICAAGFDDEEDRMAVLSADPERYEQKANAIRRHHQEEFDAKELYDCILELGFDPEDEEPEGYRSVAMASTAKKMRELVKKYDEHELAVWPVSWNKNYWHLGCKDERAETPEQKAERERKNRIDAAYDSLRERLIKVAAECYSFPELQEVAGKLRSEYGYENGSMKSYLTTAGVPERTINALMTKPAAMWETLIRMLQGCRWEKWVTRWLPPAMAYGAFIPTDEDQWLLDQAKAEIVKEDEE